MVETNARARCINEGFVIFFQNRHLLNTVCHYDLSGQFLVCGLQFHFVSVPSQVFSSYYVNMRVKNTTIYKRCHKPSPEWLPSNGCVFRINGTKGRS